MSDKLGNAPRWVPVGAAVIRLRKQYEMADIYANDEVCFNVATDTILRRLRSGQLKGRAAKYDCYEDLNPEIAPSENSPMRPEPEADGLYSIPSSFWSCLHECEHFTRELDWIAGDFEYRDNSDFYSHGGTVIGLILEERQLPSVGPFDNLDTIGQPEANAVEPKAVGRSAAKWWPDFSEELALYIHDEGIPEGIGHEGQSAMIDAIFARLVAAGKVEPSRTIVQPVINAVLRRTRSAGN